ncbi:metallophosphoesterase [uncultured Psychrobacter sp.]|uniref:metallophosphoesterase n=1 Tax=uncultured Psychrobacter sp. TaxID=259303 RepID=UPI003459F72C
MVMWFFIVFTQMLVLITSTILWWLIKPKRSSSKTALVLAVFIINNAVLVYGLTEFWRDRFHLYLVIGILQGFMIYASLITVVLAFIYYRLFKRTHRPKLIRAIGVVIYIGIVSLAVFNAYSPVVHHLTVTTTKPLDKPMNIALVSDTHLGKWFGNRQLDKLVDLIDAQNPDTVVIAGDVMNDTTVYYDKYNMHEHLSKLSAPLGVYAVLGNHDFLGYEEAIAKAVKEAGITVLDNESVLLNDAVWLVGRSDENDPNRLPATQLLDDVDTNKPVVFLEHRPLSFEEISELPVDLHLAGHTHGGQIFPLTIVMKWFRVLGYGPRSIEDTQFLVTSGYGFGPVPFRLGTRSEIWMITLQPATSRD